MADDKLASLADADPPTSWSGADTSCLLHLRARAEHEGRPVPTRHIAQLLAEALTGRRHDRLHPGRVRRLRERTATATARRPAPRRPGHAPSAASATAGPAALGHARGPRRPAARRPPDAPRRPRRLPDVLERFADNVAGRRRPRALGHRRRRRQRLHHAAGRDASARRTVVKGKSMATEETGLNEALEAAGVRRWWRPTSASGSSSSPTRRRATSSPPPSTSTATRSATSCSPWPAPDRTLDAEPEHLAAFAREQLRARFLAADLGVTGCNFAVAETGSIVLVENEGNGRFCTTVPRVHVAVMGMERIVETWDQLDLMINLLARSGTGQHLSTYTNIITGPRRPGEADGPDELHVVILDNGRSDVLGTELARDPRLHPLRRLPQRVPGLPPGRRARLRLGLLAARSAPCSRRCSPASQPEAAELAERVDAVRRLHGRLPGRASRCRTCCSPSGVARPTHASRAEQAGWSAWASAWSRPLTYRASMKAAALGRPLTRFAAMAPGLRGWGDGREAPKPAARSFMAAVEGRPGVSEPGGSVRETGDRAAFLGASARAARRPGARQRRPSDAAAQRRHPARPLGDARPDDVVGSFVRNARAVSAEVHEVDGAEVPAGLVADLVARHAVTTAVLVRRAPSPSRRRAAARGRRGRPSRTRSTPQPPPTWGSRRAWPPSPPPARSCSPRRSPAAARPACCRRRTCASCRPAASCRRRPRCCGRCRATVPMPANLVLITGPSRSGDIEQIIALGVHGPIAVEIVVLLGA